jgi:cardiolipin synthase (CMP-forming)
LDSDQHPVNPSIIVSALPNAITVGRLLAVPVMVWLIVSDRMAAAFWLFVAAGISDGVDGFIAKKFRAESQLGSYLDPLADKVMLVCIYVTLGLEAQLSSWLVILVVFRDALIIGGALLSQLLDHTLRVKPLYISKVNTVAQIILAAVVLAQIGVDFPDFPLVGTLEVIVGVTTASSGAIYLVRWLLGTGSNFEEPASFDVSGDKPKRGHADEERRRA